MTERRALIMDFLRANGWGAARVEALPGDASTRRYFRVDDGARRAMLMDQPQQAETPPAPPHATPQQRAALGYNAVARLAGADCGRFVAVAEHLRGLGVSTPQIFAAECTAGLVLMEDFGDRLYADVLSNGADETELYGAAIETLAHVHGHRGAAQMSMPLYAYDETAMLAETDLLPQWYLPLALGRQATADEAGAHRALWRDLLAQLAQSDVSFVHRDYHAQNLLWLPERRGIGRVGLIDFQDAVAGSRAYDLVSLLEDARRDVSPDLRLAMIEHYRGAMHKAGAEVNAAQLDAALAIMAAQRNAKIAGIFARLYLRDGKPRYLGYLPRVWAYLNHDVQHPSLAPLKAWFERILPEHARQGQIEGVSA
ncbi:MAG TPA: phosphotransferase [Rhizomicrobium sp.]|nr:phosphotransferase [Rhizomicrobium sp.]